jgi:NarL family two-component system sensor histidine kinase LiaS
MRRLLNRFRTLQWRFALSYMLVTVIAVACLPGAYFSASYLFVIRSPDLPRAMAAGLVQVSPQTLPYLETTSPDQVGLRLWLTDFNSNGRVQGTGSFADLWMSGPPFGTSTLSVVDASGRLIATTSDALGQPTTILAARLPSDARSVLRAALSGDTRATDLATPERNGRAEVAVPIQVPGHVLGALVLDMDTDATVNGFLPRAFLGFLGFIIAVSIAAGLIGLIFGYVISRGLTRRLRRITYAADAWSRGDFAVAAADPSQDELGRLAHDLNRMAEQVQSLLQDRQQLAVVEERNRLARDLHDSVKQQVFATAMQVAAARALVRSDPAAAEARLAEVERMVGEAQRELTGLIRELRPAALGDKGLVPALREWVADWSHSSGIAAEVRVQGERPAPLDVEQALFRVAQEALSNVARHSGARSVDVRVAWEAEGLTLAIQDDGHGFDVAERDGKGVGLGSMRERIEALGGELRVSSQAGGTHVEAQVPLAAQGTMAALADGTQAPSAQTESAGASSQSVKDEARV